MTDCKVEHGLVPTAAVATQGDDLAAGYPLAGFLQKRLVVAIDRHVALSVIDHQEQPEPTQPIGVDHPPVMHGAHLFALSRRQQNAVPAQLEIGFERSELGNDLPVKQGP